MRVNVCISITKGKKECKIFIGGKEHQMEEEDLDRKYY